MSSALTLIVSPLCEVERLVAERSPSHVLTLLSPPGAGAPVLGAGPAHLTLLTHDIAEPAEGLAAPHTDDVAALLLFADDWDGARPMLVHCWAGVSRSTAAAFVIACARRPDLDEAVVAAALRRASPYATPNARIVALADRLLERQGRMTRAIQAIGRGADCAVGQVFALELGELG
jgi:predicted protein tyrosine phosphatase